MTVAVVTDSTACLPDELRREVGDALTVVPLTVGVDDETFVEGAEITGEQVAQAEAAGRRLTTSRPAPAAFVAAYDEARRRGATEIVSVHVSSELSSTVSSARLAAVEASVPVTVIDSRTLGMAMGFAVVQGARRALEGGDAAAVADVVRRTAGSATTTFFVDSLEPLRRGGRIGRASAFLGSALSIKPLLAVQHGVIEPVERVRSTPRAMSRLVRRTADAVRSGELDSPTLAVHSLSRGDLAGTVTTELANLVPTHDGPVWAAPLGAVVTVHVGAGTVAAVVAPGA